MQLPCAKILLSFTPLLLVAVVASSAAQSQDFLAPHNAARMAVDVANLIWDPAVATYAQNYVNLQNKTHNCRSLTPSGGPYGENLFWGSSGKAWTPMDAVTLWVSSKQYYNYSNNSCAPGQQCGEYTQVVWRATTSLGCASVICNDSSTSIICSYNPAGNIVGEKPY